MSGAQTSTFGNVLYDPTAAYQAAQQYKGNQLLQQKSQREITDHDIAAVGQAAAPLLSMSPEDAAAAYPGWLQDMQSRGLAQYAPSTYPGHAATAALVQRAMPLIDQYKMGLMTSPGTQAILDRVFGTGGTTPSSVGTTTGGDGGAATTGVPAANAGALRDQLVSTLGVSPVDAGAILSNFHAESGLNAGINEIHPVIPGSRGGYGLAQWTGPRRDALEAFAQQNKLDVSQPATQLAFMKQELQQPEYAGVLKTMQAAQTPEEKAAVFFHGYLSGNAPSLEHNLPGHVARARAYAGLPAAAASSQPQGAPGASTAPGVVTGDPTRPDLAPPPPGGAPGAYPAMGAGVGAVVGQGVQPNIGGPQQTVAPPPVIRAQPIPAGRTTVGSNADIMMGGVQQAQATPLSGTQVAGPPMVASTNPTAPVAAADATPTPARYRGSAPAPTAEAAPQPGWGSQVGSGYGPQNALAPPVVQPPAAARPVSAAPAPQQPPAAAAPSVATGVNSPQFQLAQQMLRQAAAIAAMPGYQYNPQLQAAAAYLKEQAAAYAQADSVVQGPGGVQIHTLTGKQDDPAKPLPNYQETAPGSGIYLGGPGTEPRFAPSPRFGQVPGYGTVEAGPGVHNFYPINPEGLTTQEAAKTLGANTGKDVAAMVPKYIDMGQKADQAINVIDSGIQHLSDAQRGNIPTGYFAPWLATSAAALKSAGVDLSALGIDPKAVGDIQTAQKTLGIVAGSILQNTLGKDSQITDAKIEHFIHTQPGIEMDPQALQRILGWARTQFVFEHNMSIDAMKSAALSPTGTLPLNWAPKYFADKGAFGPIYNPITSESMLPTGQGPSQQTPPARPLQVPQPAAALPPAEAFAGLKDGDVRTFKNGQRWMLRNGQPVQVK